MMEDTDEPSRTMLCRFLQLIGIVSLLAFGAAVMPEKWMVEIAQELDIEPFPAVPITFYLARNLSLMYGFVGVLLLLLARDLDRYLPLVRALAGCTIVFGVAQGIVDSMSGLPVWWWLGESASTVAGGLLMGWLVRRTSIG